MPEEAPVTTATLCVGSLRARVEAGEGPRANTAVLVGVSILRGGWLLMGISRVDVFEGFSMGGRYCQGRPSANPSAPDLHPIAPFPKFLVALS
jgi:hypothetical protein